MAKLLSLKVFSTYSRLWGSFLQLTPSIFLT
jgi:hypothetical protein